MVADNIRAKQPPLTRETFSLVLDMIRMDSLPVQEALRAFLPDLSQGGLAEELRQGLLAALTRAPVEGVKADRRVLREEDASAGTESTLGQAKLEFKLRRESTQTLTVFFIDIIDYTGKSTGLQPTDMMKLITAFEDIAGGAIDEYQGRVVKKMGDGILAYFKSPVGATVAALTVQKKLAEYSTLKVGLEKIQARIGLNTGSVIRKGNDIFGPVVNVAARMQHEAGNGEVYLTDATYQKTREYVRCTALGKIQVKGIEDAITAYSAQELIADPAKIVDDSREPGLQKLKESIFVPNFKIPAGAAAENRIPSLLKDIFTEISRAIEELAADYQDEYEFKKYLQERWNALMGNM
jgi:class 3 adenylate cyclase